MPHQHHRNPHRIHRASIRPPEPVEDVLSDSAFTRSGDAYVFIGGDSGEYGCVGEILEGYFLPISDMNIPASAHYGTESKSEGDNGGEGGGGYDSDSASNYSGDSDSNFDADLSSQQGHGHDMTLDVEDSHPPTPSDSQAEQDDQRVHSGDTTPSPTSAPTEHLTNVLQHGLQSRNRRLNRRRASPPPAPEDDQPAFSPPDDPPSIPNLYASCPVEEYLKIVEDVRIKVFVESHPPYQWSEVNDLGCEMRTGWNAYRDR